MTEGESELAWARGQIAAFRERRPGYVVFAATLEQVLGKAATKTAPLAIVQARPKSIASFAEKIFRKRCANPVDEFTDLCGGRVIVHTSEEVDAISKFVEEHFEIDWDNSIDVRQRLKPSEFGYRSVHYIVSFKSGVFPTEEIEVDVPPELLAMPNHRAEVQVRTILEHAWADTAHELAYKAGFEIPDRWQREFARVAAVLEQADSSFSRIHGGLREYASSYGAYMTEDQMRRELEVLEFVLTVDPENADLAARIGKLAIELGDWHKAVDILSEYVDSQDATVLRDLGVATCKLHRDTPRCAEYLQGQGYLEAAIELSPTDADALASLAGTCKGVDDDRARELYRQAFEVDPSDPYALTNYLESEISYRRDTSVVSLTGPIIRSAIERCRDQADVGVNLPWAFYSMGEFHLMLGESYESLAAYGKALQLTTAPFMIDTTLYSLDRLAPVADKLPGHEWVLRLLLAARAEKFPSDDALRKLKTLASTTCEPISGPVVIVAGGGTVSGDQTIACRSLLVDAFDGFTGTVISGGTIEGVSGLVGDLRAACPGSIRAVGYVPLFVPADAAVDRDPGRYDEIRTTAGEGFTPLESLQSWIDLIATGTNASEVKLLGIGGGPIAAAEYRIALALGAWVAIVDGSGRAAAKLLQDDDWSRSPRLLRLPAEALTVKAFVERDTSTLDGGMRETIARAIHENYRQRQRNAVSDDLSLAEWAALEDSLKEANRKQADAIYDKLREIGCAVRAAGPDAGLVQLTDDEAETLAEVEHARWNVERLMDGWVWGPKKDVAKKTSPCIVSWAELSDEAKGWDRDTVRQIPAYLAEVGLEIVRER
jgi:ppGpp synthetase/RelA/SpoT-type nucleotidyltranferase